MGSVVWITVQTPISTVQNIGHMETENSSKVTMLFTQYLL